MCVSDNDNQKKMEFKLNSLNVSYSFNSTYTLGFTLLWSWFLNYIFSAWLNNCVGHYNHRYFFSFCLYLTMGCMYCSISGRNLFIEAYNAIDVRLCFFNTFVACFMLVLLCCVILYHKSLNLSLTQSLEDSSVGIFFILLFLSIRSFVSILR